MTGFKYCLWTGATYPARYCNLMARPNDDLCTTHRAQVDAELRMFQVAYDKVASNGR